MISLFDNISLISVSKICFFQLLIFQLFLTFPSSRFKFTYLITSSDTDLGLICFFYTLLPITFFIIVSTFCKFVRVKRNLFLFYSREANNWICNLCLIIELTATNQQDCTFSGIIVSTIPCISDTRRCYVHCTAHV